MVIIEKIRLKGGRMTSFIYSVPASITKSLFTNSKAKEYVPKVVKDIKRKPNEAIRAQAPYLDHSGLNESRIH